VLITALVGVGSDTTIGPYTHVGTGAVIAEGLSIGAGCQVMMGSFVGRSLESGSVCLGNPARVIARDEVPGDLSQG